MRSWYYLLVESVQEVDANSVDEELVVSDAGRLVLLLEDLVVVEAGLQVVGAIPRGKLGWEITRRGGGGRGT